MSSPRHRAFESVIQVLQLTNIVTLDVRTKNKRSYAYLLRDVHNTIWRQKCFLFEIKKNARIGRV